MVTLHVSAQNYKLSVAVSGMIRLVNILIQAPYMISGLLAVVTRTYRSKMLSQ